MIASTSGEMVTLEIADDGQGVDEAAVADKARRGGLTVPVGTLDAAAVLALLCTPGFSTKDETDRASGRGVGMAVVKETVDQLSGTMTLETAKGEGTRFLIQLPLTLAIADALIGRVGDEAFAVPQSAVREVMAAPACDIRQLEENELLPYRGGALPLIRLSRLFGIAAAATEEFHVFVVGTGANALGLVVDRIVGQREIVVRPISDPLARVEGISGATDLGDGRVVLILDPAAITRLSRQRAPRALGNLEQWGRLRA
jgi:two-component system chemotaxis sensor kinase CheA